jgi:hypothetical protein
VTNKLVRAVVTLLGALIAAAVAIAALLLAASN